MGVREAVGKGAWRKRYLKEYRPPSVLAHLVAQPSKHAQRLIAAVGHSAASADRAVVAWERGRTIESLKGTPFLLRNRRKILDQIADALVEHMRLGVTHGDIHRENILVSRARSRRRPVSVKLIDYEGAHALTSDVISYTERARKIIRKHLEDAVARGDVPEQDALNYLRQSLVGEDYPSIIDGIIPALAKNGKDRKSLEKYFERKFLEKVKKRL